jgi:hypothetical protein
MDTKQTKGYWALVNYSPYNLELDKNFSLNKKMKKILHQKKASGQQKIRKSQEENDAKVDDIDFGDDDDDDNENVDSDVGSEKIHTTQRPLRSQERKRNFALLSEGLIDNSPTNDSNSSLLKLKDERVDDLTSNNTKKQKIWQLPDVSLQRSGSQILTDNKNNNSNNIIINVNDASFSEYSSASNSLKKHSNQTVETTPTNPNEQSVESLHLSTSQSTPWSSHSTSLSQSSPYLLLDSPPSTIKTTEQQLLPQQPKHKRKYGQQNLQKIYWNLNNFDLVRKQQPQVVSSSETLTILKPTQNLQQTEGNVLC